MKSLVFGLVFALFSASFVHARQEIGIRAGATAKAPQQQFEPTSLVIYEVRDIAESISEETREDDAKLAEPTDRIAHVSSKDAPAPRIASRVGTLADLFDPAREQRIERATPLLAELIKKNLEPAFDPNGQSINAAGPGTLVIVATSQQHAWLARFFALAKRTTDLVQVETRWVSGPRGSFERLGLKASSTLPTKDEFAALLAKLEEEKNGAGQFDQLLAPRIVARNLQRAHISALDQIAYIKEWHVTFVQPGPQEIADPVIETINAGEILELRSVRIDTDLYRVSLDVEHVAVAQPIPTKKVRVSVAPGGEAEVGMPAVTRVNFSADVKLASGNAVVLVTPLDDKHDLALIVQLTAVLDQTPAEPVPERK